MGWSPDISIVYSPVDSNVLKWSKGRSRKTGSNYNDLEEKNGDQSRGSEK